MHRFDFGAVCGKVDDLLLDKWQDRNSEWY